ncbi:phage tail assembly chaperone [Weissella soli]|uniref:phage tail assembly chaperone n=1 Tax=Weissella soli TaxID=155866 RepID=UPI003EFA7475
MTQSSIKAFLLEDAQALEETKEINFPQFTEPFVIRSLAADEFDAITKQATKRIKKSGTYSQEVDQNKLVDGMVAGAVVTPDLNDAELQEYYGTIGDAAGTARKMLKAGQWGNLLSAIQELSGFEQESIDDLVEEVKN